MDRLQPRTPLPDLLLRFAPTPIAFSMHLAGVRIEVVTNGSALPDALAEHTLDGPPPSRTLRWTVVFDRDAGPPGPLHVTTPSGPVVTAWYGGGNLLGLDTERSEAIAFLAEGQENFCAATLVPLLAAWLGKFLRPAAAAARNGNASAK